MFKKKNSFLFNFFCLENILIVERKVRKFKKNNKWALLIIWSCWKLDEECNKLQDGCRVCREGSHSTKIKENTKKVK